MFEWIVGKILSSAIVQPVIGGLLTAQKQKLDAAGSHEARTAELAKRELDLDQREAELNSDVLKAEIDRGSWFQRAPRPVMGLSAAILVAKILVWDLALGQWTNGHTDKLSDQALWLLTTIVIAYFGARSVETIASKIAGIWKK